MKISSDDAPRELVSIVIPTYRRQEKLVRCIDSVSKSEYSPLDVIVVDDSPDGDSVSAIRHLFPSVRIVRSSGDQLVSRCRNIGIDLSRGNYVFFLDDDNVIAPNAIGELVHILRAYSTVGVVGPLMCYLQSPDLVWCAGVTRNSIACVSSFVWNGQRVGYQSPRMLESEDLPNAFMVRKRILDEFGGFDANKFPMHYEEADLCYRIRTHGYRVVVATSARTWHDVPRETRMGSYLKAFSRGNATRRFYFNARNKILFHRKWYGIPKNLVFLSLYMPLLLTMECANALRTPPYQKENLRALFRGTVDGIKSSYGLNALAQA